MVVIISVCVAIIIVVNVVGLFHIYIFVRVVVHVIGVNHVGIGRELVVAVATTVAFAADRRGRKRCDSFLYVAVGYCLC